MPDSSPENWPNSEVGAGRGLLPAWGPKRLIVRALEGLSGVGNMVEAAKSLTEWDVLEPETRARIVSVVSLRALSKEEHGVEPEKEAPPSSMGRRPKLLSSCFNVVRMDGVVE